MLKIQARRSLGEAQAGSPALRRRREERVVAPLITEWPEYLLWQLNQPAEGPAEVVAPQRLFFMRFALLNKSLASSASLRK